MMITAKAKKLPASRKAKNTGA